MRNAVQPERWTALRELREGKPPTLARLSVASGIGQTVLKGRASREGWHNASRSGRPPDVAGADAAAKAGVPQADEVPLPAAAATLEERLGRLSEMLLREIEAIGTATQGTMPDKARMDALGAMLRLLEKAEEFARARAGENNRGRDGEKADVLQRIDRRIEELARAYAKELGDDQPDAG